jgi:hypothetical protein
MGWTFEVDLTVGPGIVFDRLAIWIFVFFLFLFLFFLMIFSPSFGIVIDDGT